MNTRSRHYTSALLEAITEGIVDKDQLITDLLNWMSESDVKQFIIETDMIDYLGLDWEEE